MWRAVAGPGVAAGAPGEGPRAVDNFDGLGRDRCILLGMDPEDLAGYSPRRLLGSGPLGTVWQVRDRASGRNAALKRIPINAVPSPAQFRRTLTRLTRIHHPHLARLTTFHESDTEFLLITQYLVAGSLKSLLRRRPPLSPGELVTLLAPITSAVNHLHSIGLTHGSITQQNILFDASGRPVLTDATLHPSTPQSDLEALTTLTHHLGTLPHFQP
ncbi:protein kinase domain-containing protein, partial [Kribbella solani]|uniref:protein kinase domain-containing protein n=1 Tax=Kribbella solani TaxID=236067 RepID=UPI0029B83AFC